MSEEQNLNTEQEKKVQKPNYFSVLAFIFSIAAMILSVLTFIDVNAGKMQGAQGAAPNQISITRQYDKGKSYEKAKAKNKPMLVFFYTNWCGYCQRFAPTFNKVEKTKEIKKNFAVAYVNCEEASNREIVEAYAIQGFPTVFVVDEEGNRTKLENETFFGADAVEKITNNALKLINKD